MSETTKDTNPKDAVGTRKWRQYSTVPCTVLWEVGVAMLEGARKYGRHNYRHAGVRVSVYVDAAKGHIDQYWEGEDTDPDSGLHHVTKAIASLVVLRDAMINDMVIDDRPPKANIDKVRRELQAKVEEIISRYPDPKEPFTEQHKPDIVKGENDPNDKTDFHDWSRLPPGQQEVVLAVHTLLAQNATASYDKEGVVDELKWRYPSLRAYIRRNSKASLKWLEKHGRVRTFFLRGKKHYQYDELAQQKRVLANERKRTTGN